MCTWVLGQGGGPGPQVSEATLHGAPNEPRVGGGLTSRVPLVRVAFPTAHLGSGGRDDVAGSLSTGDTDCQLDSTRPLCTVQVAGGVEEGHLHAGPLRREGSVPRPS